MLNRFLTNAYIGIGSNLQNPIHQVTSAIEQLNLLPNSSLVSVSSLYLSRPMGPADQPAYINAVALVQTRLAAPTLLAELQSIERTHGRERKNEQWGPRTLDLDILVYGNYFHISQDLTIPHPGIKWREFVLYPLHEINKNLMIPGLGMVHRIIQRCDSNGLIKLYL